ncbi:MAG TPA: helix-turn-helix transcriptional regulator [Solirubrobacterales bacterium]|nr:helix-turn-helix transcriptional regulator [Solirubrobacterales bacterium]
MSDRASSAMNQPLQAAGLKNADAGGTNAAEALAAAEAALAAAEWSRAVELFQLSIEREESAEALEGLGWAGWWLADEELTFGARMRAFQLHRAAGERAAAARVAAWIAADFREYRGEEATARGWMQRAASLLDGLPEVPEHGWLALLQADLAINFDRDSENALALCVQARRIGRELGVSDLEAVGLAQGGCCHVAEGRVAEGMRWLDEAVAIASSEDLHLPISQGWALCCLISTCDGIGDFQRAAEWCETTRRFTERWGSRQLLGVCRSSYGRVLATQGDWTAAERELTGAVEDLRSTRPGMAAGGLARLGELRARQGREAEARELFEQAGSAGLVGLGYLELGAGNPEQAAALAQRALRRLPEAAILDRLPAQGLLTRALDDCGSGEGAAEALDEVRRASEAIGTPYLRAHASLLEADHALATGDADRARRGAEDAVDGFEGSAAPYDAAHARLALAQALARLGWGDAAERERAGAASTYEELGAAADVERARQPLAESNLPVGGDAGHELGSLTPRELEILRLVAGGKSDAEIAEELVISSHTVHRHVANIRTKLGLPSRSAAVAWATRSGLI